MSFKTDYCPEGPSNPIIIHTHYTLSATYRDPKVQSALLQAFKEQGINCEQVGCRYVSHYDSMPKDDEINISGRQKADYFVDWMTQVPITVFFNKKTFGNTLDIDKEFLIEAIQGQIAGRAFQYRDVQMKRPLRMCAGAIRGLTRRGISLFTGLHYQNVCNKLGEEMGFISNPFHHITDRIGEDKMDLIFVPEHLVRLRFPDVATGNVGIASVCHKKPQDATYPLVSLFCMGSFSKSNLEIKQRIVSAFHHPRVKSAFEELGFRFLNSNYTVGSTRPDLYDSAGHFSTSKSLPIIKTW